MNQLVAKSCLEVVALTYNDMTPAMQVAVTLPAPGGVLGRAEGIAVSLPDPMRLVSRRHLEFVLQANGHYRMSNISANNAVLVNDQSLEPGASRVVEGSERVRLGSYLLELRLHAIDHHSGLDASMSSLSDGAASPEEMVVHQVRHSSVDGGTDLGTRPASPAGLVSAQTPVDAATERVGAGPMGEVQSSAHSASMLPEDFLAEVLGESRAYATKASALPSDESAECILERVRPARAVLDDPIAQLDRHGLELSALDGQADELVRGESDPRPVSEWVRDPLDQVAKRFLDEDSVDPLLLFGEATHSLLDASHPLLADFDVGAGGTPAVNHRVEVNTPFKIPVPLGAVDRDSANVWCGSVDMPAPDAAKPESAACAQAGEVPPRAGRIEENAPHDSPSEDHDALYRALLEGMGLAEIPQRNALDPDFMRLIGRLLAIMAQGAVQLMAGRATVKREVRANVTMIAPACNNPLKFSPDGEVALLYLLGKPYPGFMEAGMALEEAFSDLNRHQLGMISGTRAALRHVLERFDPETICHGAQRDGLAHGLLAVGRKARLWDAYGRYYAAMREQADDRFQEFFGSVFLDAYEAMVAAPATQEDRQQGGA